MHILSKNTTDKNIKEIIIRTDASSSIGTGHIMRCLALADELKQYGANVSFICREEKGKFIKIESIIDYLDAHPKLKEVNGWIDAGIGRIWD